MNPRNPPPPHPSLFGTLPMTRWSAAVLERDLACVLRGLGTAGLAEFTRTPPGPDTAPLGPPDLARERDACAQRRRQLEELIPLLGLSAPSGPAGDDAIDLFRDPGVTPARNGFAARPPEPDLTAWRARSLDLRRQGEALDRRLDSLRIERERAEALCGAELPWQELRAARAFRALAGSIPEERVEDFEGALGPGMLLVRLGSSPGRRQVLVLAPRNLPPGFEATLSRTGFREEPLPECTAPTPESRVGECLREESGLRTRQDEAQSALRTLAADAAPALAFAALAVDDEERLLDIRAGLPRTERTVLLSGWVPAESREALAALVRDLTRGRCAVEFRTPTRGSREAPPVLVRPPGWLRPALLLLEPFGLPEYGELAPTLFLALGSLLMFGMMFGDVGHGLVLVAVALLGLPGMRHPRGRAALHLVAAAGLASMAFGLLYGSGFGLPGFRRYAAWRDPLEGDPLDLVRLALATGAVTVTLGLLLNVANRLRLRDWAGAILDRCGAAGLVFYGCALGWLGLPSWRTGLQAGMAAALAAWWLHGPWRKWRSRHLEPDPAGEPGESWPGILAESTVSVLEGVLLYLANTVSFVRLAAYALSHAAILAAAVLVAAQVETQPGWGPAAAVVVLVAGNAVAILLEGLVAAVQTLRLQYYEFFGKFYSGQGRPFTPFRLRALPLLPEASSA